MIANRNVFVCVRLQHFAILLAHKHISQAAENVEGGHIWFAPIKFPHSVGNTTTQCRGRHAVAGMDKGRDGVTPEQWRKFSLREESCCTLSDGAACTLCNTVLMWLIHLCVLAMDAVLWARIGVLLANVHAALVVMCGLEL